MEAWENQESSVTLTKGEWCDIVVDLGRVLDDYKRDLDSSKNPVLEFRTKQIERIERAINRIESSI